MAIHLAPAREPHAHAMSLACRCRPELTTISGIPGDAKPRPAVRHRRPVARASRHQDRDGGRRCRDG